jgi:ubiquitin carboxyl-terminal hydrolase L5
VRPALQSRIDQFASGEVHFNLMALVKSPSDEARLKVSQAESVIQSLEGEKAALRESNPSRSIEIDILIANLKEQIAGWRRDIEMDVEKVKGWKIENTRRKHNYVPCIVKLLKVRGHRHAFICARYAPLYLPIDRVFHFSSLSLWEASYLHRPRSQY